MKSISRLLLLCAALLCGALPMSAQQTISVAGVAGQIGTTNNIIPDGQRFPLTQPACDVGNWQTVSIQVNPTGTVSGGTVTFEGSNDDVTFTAVYLFDFASSTAAPVTNFTPATATTRYFVGPINARYFRARISGAITGGGSIQSITAFTNQPFSGVNTFTTSGGGIAATVNQGTAAAVTGGWPAINGELADVTGTFTNATQTTSITSPLDALSGYNTATVSINGTYATATAVFEASDDAGTTWYAVQGMRSDSAVAELGYTTLTNTTRQWTVNIQGNGTFRVRSTAVASGTANIRISISSAPSAQTTAQLAGLTNGQQAAANSLPVALANEDVQDLFITGQAAQTTLSNNIILAVAGSGSTDTVAGTPAVSYRSVTFQIETTAGIAGGVITWEASNDNTNFFAFAVTDTSQNIPTGQSTTLTLSASAHRFFEAPVKYRYIRVRISTGVTGGSVQCFTRLSTAPYAYGPGGANVNLADIAGLGTASSGANGVLPVGGNIANGVTPTASPVLTAGLSLSTVPAAAIANGKTVSIPVTGDQQVIVHQDGDPTNEWQASSGTTPLAVATSTTLKAAGGSGIRNYVTAIQCYNNSATVATTVSILDGASVIWTGYLPATTAALPVVPVQVVFRTALKGTAATAMNIQLGTTASSVFYNVQGFQNN